jgi:hypothetical protein
VQTNDITALLKEQILNFEPVATQVDVGEVMEIGDGIALVSGLDGAMAGGSRAGGGDTSLAWCVSQRRRCIGAGGLPCRR